MRMFTLRGLALTVVMLLLSPHWEHHEALAARILALLPTASHSHHIWNRSLMLALVARGHHVTVVSPDPEKEPIPNHRDIVLEGLYDHMFETFDYVAMAKMTMFQMVLEGYEWGIQNCNHGLGTKGAKQLLDLSANETFDLIIVESAMTECFLGFVSKFGSPPLMGIVAFNNPPWTNSLLGNPDNAAYICSYLLPYSDHMTLQQRMANFLLNSFALLYRSWYHIPEQNKIARNFFGNALPSISEIEKNISLVLVNSHHTFDYPRPMVPAMIPVAGMHIKPSKPLPKDLQTFLDEAKEGVIYFSLGSNIRSDKIGIDKRTAFLEAFSQLPQKVLWKWESDTLPGQPKNVKLGKWLPQNDILAHPNVRLFITHSGLMSTQESFYHGLPVVGMPFLADQYANIAKIVERGLGEKLDYKTLTKESILEAVQKVISNPSYLERAKNFSTVFQDQPESPLERAVYWTEYVIRHKGAPHLRSAAIDLHWYQYLLLDVIGLFVAGVAIVLLVIYFSMKMVLNTIISSKKIKTKKC